MKQHILSLLFLLPSIVRYHGETGLREVLVAADVLVPQGQTSSLPIDDCHWSNDASKLLVFTNSRKVWRTNTRGGYWVLDLGTNALIQQVGRARQTIQLHAYPNRTHSTSEEHHTARLRNHNVFLVRQI